jgi:hypothetical protein
MYLFIQMIYNFWDYIVWTNVHHAGVFSKISRETWYDRILHHRQKSNKHTCQINVIVCETSMLQNDDVSFNFYTAYTYPDWWSQPDSLVTWMWRTVTLYIILGIFAMWLYAMSLYCIYWTFHHDQANIETYIRPFMHAHFQD